MNTQPNPPLFERMALIGIGLIGSSLAHAARRHGLVGRIAACSRTRRTLDKAIELEIADETTLDPREAVADADLVMICTPVGAYAEIAADIAPALKPGCIVSDTGSVKGAVMQALGPHMPEGVHLVPGHPVAGTEYSGPEAGFAELFEGRWCILTPPPGADEAAVAKITELWERCGMTVTRMDIAYHDRVLAITSHLPHLIAYTIVGTATDLEGQIQQEVIKFSAGGFRDFTRIASSDPTMWRDIFLNNKEAVLEILQRFNEDLTALQRAIRWGEGDYLQEKFTRTREIRRGIIEAKQV